MGRFFMLQQIEVNKQGLRRCIWFKREGTLPACSLRNHATRLRINRKRRIVWGDVSKGGIRAFLCYQDSRQDWHRLLL